MGIYLMMLASLGIFALRDSQLLALAPQGLVFRRFLLYISALALQVLALDFLRVPREPEAMIRMFYASPLWMALLALHLGNWSVCTLLRRAGKTELVWLVLLLPAPLIPLNLRLLSASLAPLMFPTELLFIVSVLVWSMPIAILVREARQTRVVAQNADWSAEFGGRVNLLALYLVPVPAIFREVGQWLEVLKTYLVTD